MRRDAKYRETHARLAAELDRPAALHPPLEGGSRERSDRGEGTLSPRVSIADTPAAASPTRNSRSANCRPPLKGEAKGEKSSHAGGRRRGEAALSARPAPSRGKLYRLASNFILPRDYMTIEQVRALDHPGADVPQVQEKPEPEVRVYWND